MLPEISGFFGIIGILMLGIIYGFVFTGFYVIHNLIFPDTIGWIKDNWEKANKQVDLENSSKELKS